MNFPPILLTTAAMAGGNACPAQNRVHSRGRKIDVPRGGKMDGSVVREKFSKHGMRNSNVLAIAPTATLSNIMGTTPCSEPNYKNLYVKSNLGGEFIILNAELLRDLKKLNLWNQEMLDPLKTFDGELDAMLNGGTSEACQ